MNTRTAFEVRPRVAVTARLVAWAGWVALAWCLHAGVWDGRESDPHWRRRITGGDMWKVALENPVAATVRFQGLVTAYPEGQGSVVLNGAIQSAINTNDFYTTMAMDPGEVALEFYKTYELQLIGDINSYRVEVQFTMGWLHDLLGSTGPGAHDYNRYALFVLRPNGWERVCENDWLAYDQDADGDGDYEPFVGRFLVQLRPEAGARPVSRPGETGASMESQGEDPWNGDREIMDATTAPGDEEPLRVAGGKGDDSALTSLEWSVSLGRLYSGRSAGKLRLVETRLTTNVFTPRALLCAPTSADTNEFELIKLPGDTNQLAQVSAPQTFVDVQTPASNSFELRFYPPEARGSRGTNGLYALQAGSTPFVAWRIESPAGAGTNQLRLSELRPAITNLTLVEYISTNSPPLWRLTQGTGADARIETRLVSVTSSNRLELVEVRNGSGVLSDKTGELYHKFGWGHELIAVTNDVGGSNLVMALAYASNGGQPSSYKKLTAITYPDGHWERRADSTNSYDDEHPYGSLRRIVRPWLNAPSTSADNDCWVTSYQYPSALAGGSHWVQQWHDALASNEDPESDYVSAHQASTTHEQGTEYEFDLCSGEMVLLEQRSFGGINHYGVFIDTESYGPWYGRLGGHTYSKQDSQVGGARVDAYDYVFGAWDATNRVFTPWPTAGSSNDVRQVIYHGADRGDDTHQLTTGESGLAIKPVWLAPFQSTKEVRTICRGNLVAIETHVYTNAPAKFALIDRVHYQRDALGHATNVFRVDPATGQTNTVLYQADWQGTNAFPGDFKLSETDRYGRVRRHTYDTLKRTKTVTEVGHGTQPDIVRTYTYDAAGRVLSETVTASSLQLLTTRQFDGAGRLRSVTGPDGLTTSYAYPSGGLLTNLTFSSGTTLVISNYLDRRVASLTGTAVTNHFFTYSLVPEGHTHSLYPKNVTTVTNGSAASMRWTATVTDHRDVLARELRPAFGLETPWSRTLGYSEGGQLLGTRETGFDSEAVIPTDYSYDLFGERVFEGRDGPDVDLDVTIALASTDRLRTFGHYYEINGSGHWFKVNERLEYPADNSATPVLGERTKTRFTGFALGELSEELHFDGNTNQTTLKVVVDRANKKVTTTTTIPQSSLAATNIVFNGLLQTENTPTVANPTSHYYDALGREIATKTPLGFTTGKALNAAGQVVATTNLSGQVTTYQYYPASGTNAGLLYCQTGPTGRKTYFNYNGRGQTTHVWGDVPYPEKRGYNDFGDLTTLTTYQTAAAWTGTNWPTSEPGGNVTTWQYDESTGLLTNKVDALGQGVQFAYYPNGTPLSRLWARGLASTNSYSPNGDLLQVDYAEGATVVSIVYGSYNRSGAPRSVTDGSGVHTLTYDHLGRLVADACNSGLLSGVTVSNRLDRVKGKDRVQVQAGATTLTHNYGFDTYGRLSAVTNGTCSAAYAYLTGSDLIASTVSTNTGAGGMIASRTWDYGYRLRSLMTTTNSSCAVVAGFNYLYDALDRRTQVTLADSSRWVYGYNDRDEVISGKRSWVDWSPVTGQQFEYGYDPIGNRTLAKSGGDTAGGTLRANGYTVNALNQYTTATNQGYKHVCGAAIATNSVAVNGSTNNVDRRGEYFHSEVTVANASTSVWQTVSLGSGGTTTNLGFVFPKQQQALAYDADGNLTFDGIWAYRWDGENRLVELAMTNVSGIPDAQRKRLQFTYDHLGRRASKAVSSWTGSGFGSATTTRFVHDLPGGENGGWRLLTELDGSGNIVRSYTWGLDLSGTLDGAGGIGGLLFLTEHGGTLTDHLVAYDGNGNVAALVRTDGTETARYEYGPLGELIRANGLIARTNPVRWSTKFSDEESELVYYGYRYYSPSLGRWISRDPIAEDGGANIYTFCLNSASGTIDVQGATSIAVTITFGVGQFVAGAGFSVGLDLFRDRPIDWADALITGTLSSAGYGALSWFNFAKNARYGTETVRRIVTAPGFKMALGQMNGPVGQALQSAFAKQDLLLRLLAAQGGAFIAKLFLDWNIDLFDDE